MKLKIQEDPKKNRIFQGKPKNEKSCFNKCFFRKRLFKSRLFKFIMFSRFCFTKTCFVKRIAKNTFHKIVFKNVFGKKAENDFGKTCNHGSQKIIPRKTEV